MEHNSFLGKKEKTSVGTSGPKAVARTSVPNQGVGSYNETNENEPCGIIFSKYDGAGSVVKIVNEMKKRYAKYGSREVDGRENVPYYLGINFVVKSVQMMTLKARLGAYVEIHQRCHWQLVRRKLARREFEQHIVFQSSFFKLLIFLFREGKTSKKPRRLQNPEGWSWNSFWNSGSVFSLKHFRNSTIELRDQNRTYFTSLKSSDKIEWMK